MMKLKQMWTPLINKLTDHYKNHTFSLHVPGHKYGELWLKKDLLTFDVTELTGLDDLHGPTGVIKEAQALTASQYKVDRSYFLINGSTVGNLAVIRTICPQGSNVIVQRNCHKSIINGLQLVDAHPILVTPEVDDLSDIPTGVKLEHIKKAFTYNEDISAVILTNPNYYGMVMDLSEIIKYVHAKGVPVLVDEAHGAHFGIGDPFPPSSLSMGADVVVQSAHKTLPAMTMASFLHVQSSLFDYEHLEENLRLFQSSSPSYPLMASLDHARAYLGALEKKDVVEIAQGIQALRLRLHQIPQIEVVSKSNTYDWLDPIKLTVKTNTALSGYQLQLVFQRAGIYTELADPDHVLFVLPLSPFERIEELASIIEKALKKFKTVKTPRPKKQRLHNLPNITVPIRTGSAIQTQPKKRVSVKDSVGKISAETIVPYPPGIPIIVQGERILEEQVNYCVWLLEYGARFQGNNIRGNGIQVICEDTFQQESRR